MPLSKGTIAAKKLLSECGISDPTEIPLELIATGRGATVRNEPLNKSDGRIVFGRNRCIISINSNIEFEGRKRFTLGHELGHFELHKTSLEVHNDNESTLNWFNDKIRQSKKGVQEAEANQFATELLMPAELFVKVSAQEKFSPDLVRYLSDKFQTSRTSVIFRFMELGNHPICVFYSYNNKLKYWKKSVDFRHYIVDRINLAPPEDSVAAEYFNNAKIYPKDQSKQQIWKSTWLDLKEWENDTDYNFYEYCIITPRYNTVLSVVWEE
jgi:Zn-dependent peptidase ImmA (M78 family)